MVLTRKRNASSANLQRSSSKDAKRKIHPPEAERYEVKVDTGLDTIKRIKLIFRGDEKRNVERVTPDIAIEDGERIPNASELYLDDNTPPPSPIPLRRKRKYSEVSVVIPYKSINKDLYTVFSSEDINNDQWLIIWETL